MGGIKGQRREMSNPVRLIFLLQVNIQIPRMNLDNFKMKYTFTRPHRTETHLHCGGVWCSKWMANGYATEMLEEAELNWHSMRWLTLAHNTAAVSARFQYSSAITRWSSELKNCDDTPAIPRYCAGILGIAMDIVVVIHIHQWAVWWYCVQWQLILWEAGSALLFACRPPQSPASVSDGISHLFTRTIQSYQLTHSNHLTHPFIVPCNTFIHICGTQPFWFAHFSLVKLGFKILTFCNSGNGKSVGCGQPKHKWTWKVSLVSWYR